MNTESIMMIVLILVALATGLVTFGVLRERDRPTWLAGCAAVAAGLAIVACFVLFSIVRILM